MTSPSGVPWQCGWCHEPTIIEVRSSWKDKPTPDRWFDEHLWTIGRCTKCLQPHAFLQSDNPFAEGWRAKEQVFPVPQQGLSHEVPESMRETFDEAQRCMSVRAYRAAAVMARSLVEQMANDLGANGRTLHHKLEDLRRKEVLDHRLLEWSTLVKDIGNEGAHETSQSLSQEDATEVLAFAEALADYLYAYRRRYERFQERRKTWRLIKDAPHTF